jgi:hypothetical protein
MEGTTTKSGRPIIPIELLHRNPVYIPTASKRAYPNATEAGYTDDYFVELIKAYSLEDVTGDRAESIASREYSSVGKYVIGSPLKNSEGEYVMAMILIRSAQAGWWEPGIIDVPRLRDTKIQTAKEYLESVEKTSPSCNKGMMDGGMIFGLSVAKRGGMVVPFEHDNKVIIAPTQMCLEYFLECNR